MDFEYRSLIYRIKRLADERWLNKDNIVARAENGFEIVNLEGQAKPLEFDINIPLNYPFSMGENKVAFVAGKNLVPYPAAGNKHFLIILSISFLAISCNNQENSNTSKKEETATYKTNSYDDLVTLFKEWRTFENPPKLDGAPDYTKATFEKRWPQFKELQNQLKVIDTSNWSIANQVDWMIVWAEMNGFDFNYRVLKPWERDPAFYKTVWTYKSDVPAHEGPTHHAVLELWSYQFPLSKSERGGLIKQLQVIPPLNTQAQKNLTGNARDLFITGIRDIEQQKEVLLNLQRELNEVDDLQVIIALNEAIESTSDFILWLKTKAKTKTGPSGIGKDNYTWYLQNVHLVPLTWDDEVMILKRELARAWTSLKLEEHRNRKLPQLTAANSVAAYNKLAETSARSFLDFLEKNKHNKFFLRRAMSGHSDSGKISPYSVHEFR